MDLLPLQPGDVLSTQADVSELSAAVGFRPSTSVEEGVGKFVEWYRDYYAKELISR
jgi:UDP-glucuronate 4-epimerase